MDRLDAANATMWVSVLSEAIFSETESESGLVLRGACLFVPEKWFHATYIPSHIPYCQLQPEPLYGVQKQAEVGKD